MSSADQSDALLELLVQWEEARRAGKTPTVEELAPGDVRLQALLRERLKTRQRLQAVLDLPDETKHEDAGKPGPTPAVAGYDVGDLLGRGGMGLVYKAMQRALQRKVALKMVISGANASPAERG